MEAFSALLALCAGNSPANGEFPARKPVTRSFHVFFDLRLNKRLSKQWWCWWFDTPSCPLWRHCNEVQSTKCQPGNNKPAKLADNCSQLKQKSLWICTLRESCLKSQRGNSWVSQNFSHSRMAFCSLKGYFHPGKLTGEIGPTAYSTFIQHVVPISATYAKQHPKQLMLNVLKLTSVLSIHDIVYCFTTFHTKVVPSITHYCEEFYNVLCIREFGFKRTYPYNGVWTGITCLFLNGTYFIINACKSKNIFTPNLVSCGQYQYDGIGAKFSTHGPARSTQDLSNHGEDSTLPGDLPWSWKDHEDNGLRCHVSGGCGSGWILQEGRHASQKTGRGAYHTAALWWPAGIVTYAEVWTRLSGEWYRWTMTKDV